MPLAVLPLQDERDVVEARRAIREIAAAMGFDDVDQLRLTAAVSELSRHICLHRAGGRVVVDEAADPRRGLLLAFEDPQPCTVDDLAAEAWFGDELTVDTDEDGTTRVVVTKWLSSAEEA